jgi:hypothetical protein
VSTDPTDPEAALATALAAFQAEMPHVFTLPQSALMAPAAASNGAVQ